MASASAASRVNVRDVLRVKAVESYVRNFAGESHRLQELLEVTLSYGVYCVSRNFQLKGMTIDELRTVTKHDHTKTQDFYVRNAAKPRRPELIGAADPQQLYGKAPHSWRDGESKSATIVAEDLPPNTSNSGEPEVFFLPSEAHKDKLDEIDFYTRVLGKAFVDVAWATYSSRGSAFLDSQQLQDRMTRVDQRKRPDRIPPTELPVCSFVEFLNAYVKTSVAKISALTEPTEALQAEAVDAASMEAVDSTAQQTRPTSINTRYQLDKGREAVRVSTPRPRTPPAPLTPRDGARGTARPNAFQNVQSKIKPELRAHKEKLLRVKKTQTQLMKESLARARLAEYAAKQEDNGATNAPLPVKRMPLDRITPGAAALEIVDDFIRSPLMDKFTGEVQTAHRPSSRDARRDPLKEELYGTAAHDDSFLGCRAPASQPKRASRTSKEAKKSTRDYSGWLGDFGPQHTKTVRPAWDTDATGGDHDFHADGSSDGEYGYDTENRQNVNSAVAVTMWEPVLL